MTPWERYFLVGRRAGCPKEQMDRFPAADVILQAAATGRRPPPRDCATAGRADGHRLRRCARRRKIALAARRRWARTIASACRD